MLNTLVDFTDCCRSYGLRVSTSELLDCYSHLSLIDPLDETTFRTVLQSNFAKSRREQNRFKMLYTLFFHESSQAQNQPRGLSIIKNDASISPGNKRKPWSEQEENISDAITSVIDHYHQQFDDGDGNSGSTIERSLLDFIQRKPGFFLEQIHQLNTMAVRKQTHFKSNMDQLSGRLSVMLTINQMRQKILQIAGSNDDHLDVDATSERHSHGFRNRLQSLLNHRLDQAYALLTDEPRENNEALIENQSVFWGQKILTEKPFSSLSPLEIVQVREVMDSFAKKLKNQAGRRFAVKSRGRLNINKTLREAGRFQGTPLKLSFKDKPLNKARLIVLCDVSGSVWSSARFMLNILYSLQECFHRIKSFVFVSGIHEVTDYFNDFDVNDAIEKLLTASPINISAPTDYGMVFHLFNRDHLHLLDHKTTLIIMGDGRSNYLNPQAHLLGVFRERCRRIIWLTPEPGNLWNSGDSELHTYKSHCHELRTCMNMNHLQQFIHELVL